MISAFPEKEVHVLGARYGLEGEEIRTLCEIAAEVHVTRQRVCQVENKALMRLQKGPSRLAVAAFIDLEKEQQWNVLAGIGSMLPADEISERASV